MPLLDLIPIMGRYTKYVYTQIEEQPEFKTIMLAQTDYPLPMSALKAPQSIEENGGLTQQ